MFSNSIQCEFESHPGHLFGSCTLSSAVASHIPGLPNVAPAPLSGAPYATGRGSGGVPTIVTTKRWFSHRSRREAVAALDALIGLKS